MDHSKGTKISKEGGRIRCVGQGRDGCGGPNNYSRRIL